MTYDEYRSLRNGNRCVIIKTGEPGTVLAINRETDDVLVEAKRVARGRVKEWFNYTYIAKL